MLLDVHGTLDKGYLLDVHGTLDKGYLT